MCEDQVKTLIGQVMALESELHIERCQPRPKVRLEEGDVGGECLLRFMWRGGTVRSQGNYVGPTFSSSVAAGFFAAENGFELVLEGDERIEGREEPKPGPTDSERTRYLSGERCVVMNHATISLALAVVEKHEPPIFPFVRPVLALSQIFKEGEGYHIDPSRLRPATQWEIDNLWPKFEPAPPTLSDGARPGPMFRRGDFVIRTDGLGGVCRVTSVSGEEMNARATFCARLVRVHVSNYRLASKEEIEASVWGSMGLYQVVSPDPNGPDNLTIECGGEKEFTDLFPETAERLCWLLEHQPLVKAVLEGASSDVD